MTLTITLKPETEAILKNCADVKGYAVEDYVEKLIVEDSKKIRTLDEIFAPVRRQLEEQKVSEEELDEIITSARRDYFTEKKSREGK